MLKKTQESIGLRGACWNGRERTSLAMRARVCMGSEECERVVRGAQEFARIRKLRRDRVMQKRAGVRSMLLLRRWEENPGRLSTVWKFRATNAQGAKNLALREIAWSRAKTQQAPQRCPRADVAGRTRSPGNQTALSRIAAALLATATPVPWIKQSAIFVGTCCCSPVAGPGKCAR